MSHSENTSSMAPPTPLHFSFIPGRNPLESNLLPYSSGMTVMFLIVSAENSNFFKRQNKMFLLPQRFAGHRALTVGEDVREDLTT